MHSRFLEQDLDDVQRTREAAHEARHEVRRLAEKVLGYAGSADRGERAADIALAAAELLANSVLHGAGARMQVSVTEDGECLRVEVRDSFVGEIGDADDDLLGESGRGLMLVQAVSAEYGSRQDAAGTTFWFTVAL